MLVDAYSAMTSDSKIFVGLKSIRSKPVSKNNPAGPKCQWDGCDRIGAQRAPVGRNAEGLFLFFCQEHVKLYNRGYNYSSDLSEPAVARYQKEAASGARQVWGTVVEAPRELPIPSTERSGSAKASNARKSSEQRKEQTRELAARRLRVLEAKAFETLGLHPESTPQEIRSRYKERLKMHHPDVNQGNRTAEADLRAAIDAHKILKLNGFC